VVHHRPVGAAAGASARQALPSDGLGGSSDSDIPAAIRPAGRADDARPMGAYPRERVEAWRRRGDAAGGRVAATERTPGDAGEKSTNHVLFSLVVWRCGGNGPVRTGRRDGRGVPSRTGKCRRCLLAAKKNTSHATSPQTPKGRRPKAAASANLATEASAPAEAVLAEAAGTPADPQAESLRIARPTQAEEAATATAEMSPGPAPLANKLSAPDAAAKVLGQTGQAMSCPELITAMAAQGYWSSPTGRTPVGTLYSAILRELQTKGEQARFVKSERGPFTLRGAV
jgi:hypothetical protein